MAKQPEGDDRALMVAVQRGDRAAFETLFQRHKRALINFAFRFTRRQETAEELAQDILVKVYQAAPSYSPDARFTTWLFRIARNHCLNELRRSEYRARKVCYDEAAASTCATPEATVAARRKIVRVEQALAALPEAQRTALVLSRLHQLSYEEIASAMQTTVSAVKSLLNRAKKKLVSELSGAP